MNKKIEDLFYDGAAPQVTFVDNGYIYEGIRPTISHNRASYDGEHIVFFSTTTDNDIGVCNVEDIGNITVTFKPFGGEEWVVSDKKTNTIIFKSVR